VEGTGNEWLCVSYFVSDVMSNSMSFFYRDRPTQQTFHFHSMALRALDDISSTRVNIRASARKRNITYRRPKKESRSEVKRLVHHFTERHQPSCVFITASQKSSRCAQGVRIKHLLLCVSIEQRPYPAPHSHVLVNIGLRMRLVEQEGHGT
jgi:hypothetical protein